MKCRFKTRSGQPCRFVAIAPDGGCAAHSQHPVALAARRERQAKGGRNHSTLARAMRIVKTGPYAELADVLERAAREVYDGNLDPQRGVALSQLARGIVVVADAAAPKTEVDDSDLSAFLAHLSHPEPPSGGAMNDDTGPKA